LVPAGMIGNSLRPTRIGTGGFVNLRRLRNAFPVAIQMIREQLKRTLPLRLRHWAYSSFLSLFRFARRPCGRNATVFFRCARAHPFSRIVRGRHPGWPGAAAARDRGKPLKILVLVTPCCWSDFVFPIIQLSQAMRGRNHSVSYLAGNGGHCVFLREQSRWTGKMCPGIYEEIDRHMLKSDEPLEVLDEMVTPELARQAVQWREENGDMPLGGLQYGGLPFWEIVKFSYLREMGPTPLPGPTDTINQIKEMPRLAEGFVRNYELIKRRLEANRPDAILIFSGFFYLERIALELARKMGIRVVGHENSNFRDRRIFDTSGQIGNNTSVSEKTWPPIKDRVLNPSQSERLDKYLAGVWNGANNTIRQAKSASAGQIRRQLGLKEGAPMALLIGQVAIDTVVLNDLKAFATSLEFIAGTIEIFESMPETTLVVRLHPFEASYFNNATFNELRKMRLPSNVRLVQGREINTYSLMRMADFGITSTSQAGLEMLAIGKPLISVGRAFYANKGFTRDAATREDLANAIREMSANPRLSEDQTQRVRNFLYHIIFEHQIEYDPDCLLFPPKSIDRIEAMLHGQDPVAYHRSAD
jgi:capsule polysaccharide modification protein KpsS